MVAIGKQQINILRRLHCAGTEDRTMRGVISIDEIGRHHDGRTITRYCRVARSDSFSNRKRLFKRQRNLLTYFREVTIPSQFQKEAKLQVAQSMSDPAIQPHAG